MKVEPKKLVMAGIATDEEESIDPGFHLRWFIGPIKFPLHASPFPDLDQLETYLNSPAPSNLPSSKLEPAFILFRREHHFHLDHQVSITVREIRSLIAGEVLKIRKQGVVFRLKRKQTLFVNPHVDSGGVFNRIRITFSLAMLTLVDIISNLIPIKLNLFKSWGDPEIEARFPKTIHCLEVSSKDFFSWSTPTIVMKGFADGDSDPLIEEHFEWQRVSWWQQKSRLKIDQGHYDLVRFRFDSYKPITIQYSYMEKDVKIAEDSNNLKRSEWVRIATIPFISSFSNWNSAKNHHFPPEYIESIINRYIDFQNATGNLSNSQRLDLKYKPIFTRLQRIFLSLVYAGYRDWKSFIEYINENLVEFEFTPETFLNIFSIDPLIATLLGLKYLDAGPRNQTPTSRDKFDYMIVSGWEDEGKNLCYITQKVSLETTPGLVKPTSLRGDQEDGLKWEGHVSHYRAGLTWDISERHNLDYQHYAPIAFDIWRGDQADAGSWITILFNENAQSIEERIVDRPVVVPDSYTYPTNEEDRSRFIPERLEVLDLDRALFMQDATFPITAAQFEAYEALISDASSYFLSIEDESSDQVTPIHSEWLPLSDSQRNVYYRVRGIDIFGRVSERSDPCKVTLSRKYPPPEVVGLRAFLESNQSDPNKKDIVVSWRIGPYQQGVGETINHFNIVHKEIETRAKARVLNVDQPTPESEWRKFGNEWFSGVLKPNVPFQAPIDIVFMNPPAAHKIAGTILGCSKATSNAIVIKEINGTPSISTSNFEEQLAGGFILTITTDQCYLGINPFVDIRDRYKQADSTNAIELDQVELKIEEEVFSVIGFEGGESLRLTIAFDGECKKFMDRYGGKPFELEFKTVKNSFEWWQEIHLDDLKNWNPQLKDALESVDIESPPDNLELLELLTQIDGDVDLSDIQKENKKKQAIETFYLINQRNITFPINSLSDRVEITGRESWFTLGAVFEYEIENTKYRIPIVDFKAHIEDDRPHHDGPPNKRAFLEEITLGDVVFEEETEGGPVHSVPILQKTIAEKLARSGQTKIKVNVRKPPSSIIEIDHDDDNSEESERLKASRGGEIDFEDTHQNVYIAEVISRPCNLGNDKLSFLIRERYTPLDLPDSQTIGMDHVSPIRGSHGKFHHVYRERVLDIRSELQADTTKKFITNISVSTHRDPYDEGDYSSEEKENLVSQAIEIIVPPEPPPKPTTLLADGVTDPFFDLWTTLPKILDGKKVTQFEMRLSDENWEGNANGVLSADNKTWEIFRAHEDSLRALMVKQRKESNPGFDALEFNKTPQDEMRALIIDQLVHDWEEVTSLKQAFIPVAKLHGNQNPILKCIDQIENVAAGRAYYAVKEYREGAASGDATLLPFRANIVDTSPPASPSITKYLRENGKTTILRRPNKEPDLYGYEVYRTDDPADADDIRKMALVKRLLLHQEDYDLLPEDEKPIHALVQHAPLMLKPMRRDISVRRLAADSSGKIDLFFPIDTLDIPNADSIVGIFEADTLSEIDDLSVHDYSSDQPLNYWDTNSANGSQVSADRRSLLGINAENKTRIVVVYVDSENEHQVLRSIRYHSIILEGISEDQLGNVNGIFPTTALKVYRNKVPLIFESSIHGINSADQIKGVYRRIPTQEDPASIAGYGSFNHWGQIWPDGESNEDAGLSSDNRSLENLILPNGTEVVIEYEDTSGNDQFLTQVLNDPIVLDTSFLGLLPGTLASDPANDPQKVSHRLDGNGNRTRNLMIMLDNAIANQLGTPTPVRVRFGDSVDHYDTGMNELVFTDRSQGEDVDKEYKVVALKRVFTTLGGQKHQILISSN